MIVREAGAADWPHIWPFFRAITAAGETYTYPRDLTEPAARALWMIPAPGHVLVAENSDGTILGSAKVGPNQMGPGSHVASASFMVDPARRGAGIGRMLGEAAIGWAAAQGFRAMQFNAVVATNTPAVALWQKLGFAIIATVPEAFDHPVHGLVGLHIMHRRLDRAADGAWTAIC
ncbi:GNAT family N-acetyltransferase [Sphingomonas cavernae]|uniref:GNAT family N-acetyltransferase n=1 Tax=Sphingomonas cavernae TaxID=2320861 RepID=A0A418WKH3_9SPHN|nr:GNAT family N-acetyltransferase [Sphingomonas cavernae]RJF90329.1 GNAT family N-acetyltransferase [Sphingomonas cavernae]